ncbi:Na/Pi cotransporter family protein [Hoyosella rhizosphaerae]|uniref:Na/Pi cotransporter family protein n=1 Tax=Hoyosella rhizosphaerae TaxID=1755582 RepID=A0A916XCR2_9ACTN|nr:Na/Pi symporter [Hoyosella rhizosphaerae]MBN4927447.1 Na/Pi cotransporter family protein [Hoyosella rhizosphaerae]GGC64325.1 hypothetical protein GCM10011410_16070 [Hoyosella rhizosphaerae]
MNLASVGTLLGGLGLFLLGVIMMTDGLKLAAGSLLQTILRKFTQTPIRGLLSGVLVTGVVQSSTAVIVTLIGFANAGLLSFAQTLWVIFGANLGTSMTGWLVATIGFNVKIEALALPLIGIGIALKISGSGTRRGAFGTAIAGFGVLFIGIDLLQEAFSDVSANITIPTGDGAIVIVYLLGFGVLMTFIMQSSSAALAITLTATQTGVLPITSAAYVAIGVNIGTAVTSAIAAVGATSNAKRTAGAHILFNVITGLFAVLTLPLLLPALIRMQEATTGNTNPTISLALFHTTFNAIGVLLMIPIAGWMARWLGRQFTAQDNTLVKPQFLDDTAAEVPELGINALRCEVSRAGKTAIETTLATLNGGLSRPTAAATTQSISDLGETMNDFVNSLHRNELADDASIELADVLRAKRCYETIAHQWEPLIPFPDSQLGEAPFVTQARTLLGRAQPELPISEPQLTTEETDRSYRVLRQQLLQAGSTSHITVAQMDRSLNAASALRQILKKAVEAQELLRAKPRSLPPEGADA